MVFDNIVISYYEIEDTSESGNITFSGSETHKIRFKIEDSLFVSISLVSQDGITEKRYSINKDCNSESEGFTELFELINGLESRIKYYDGHVFEKLISKTSRNEVKFDK